MAKKTFKIKENLADALKDTVNSAINNAGELHVEIIPLKKIIIDPENPREFFLDVDDLYNDVEKNDPNLQQKLKERESLSSIAASIAEQGIINPIVVYKENGFYKLIAGERRTLGSILAKKIDIPAKILTSKPDLLKISLLQWIENIEREDLSLWERLKNLEKIITAYSLENNLSAEQITPTIISKLLSCSLQQAVNYNNVLKSSKTVRSEIKLGTIKNIEKAAFIAKADPLFEDRLLNLCLKGATLAQMKSELQKLQHFQEEEFNCSLKITDSSKDSTKKAKILEKLMSDKVAKNIIFSILENNSYKHLNSLFENLNLNESKFIFKTLSNLLNVLEKEE